MILLFQENGAARIQQNSGSVELQAGQWCAFQTDHPPLISASSRSRQLAISLPLRMLSDPRLPLESWYAAQSFRSGAAQIFYCAAVAAALTPAHLDKTDSFRVGASLAQLLEIALRDRLTQDPPGAITKRREQALHFIESNLANPALGVTMIADAIGCSPRMVHKLFQNDMLTVGRHILAMRLDRCHAELSNAVPAQIDDIAFKWGFVSPQHFRRSFKQRFGCSPRDCRKGAIARLGHRPEYPAGPGTSACT